MIGVGAASGGLVEWSAALTALSVLAGVVVHLVHNRAHHRKAQRQNEMIIAWVKAIHAQGPKVPDPYANLKDEPKGRG